LADFFFALEFIHNLSPFFGFSPFLFNLKIHSRNRNRSYQENFTTVAGVTSQDSSDQRTDKKVQFSNWNITLARIEQGALKRNQNSCVTVVRKESYHDLLLERILKRIGTDT
jgi:hypothetical protein